MIKLRLKLARFYQRDQKQAIFFYWEIDFSDGCLFNWDKKVAILILMFTKKSRRSKNV
jgi:hypothetical protein